MTSSHAALLLLVCSGSSSALRTGPVVKPTTRRAVLSSAAAAAVAAAAPGLASAADKGYMTMDEYQKVKRQALKDEKLYGLFESLRVRAGQTGEFDKLAEDD